MDKPVIFFSHSTKDAAALRRLKDRFVELTGGTIDVFLSSDGQSIRFGTSWASSIESALSKAKLMFVFVTPNSRRSSWVYFEAGHAVAKGTHVVPIGMFGVDIGALPPPLNLLQGFNITGPEGLNNLIFKVNEVFGHAHKLAFTSDDLAGLTAIETAQPARLFGKHVAAIDELYLASEARPSGLGKLSSVLAAIPGHRIPHARGCTLPGAEIGVDDTRKSLGATIAPFFAHVAMPIVEAAFREILGGPGPGEPPPYELSVTFAPIVAWDEDAHVIMGKLHGKPVTPAPDQDPDAEWKRFEHGDICFSVGHKRVFDPPPTQPAVFFESPGPLFTELDLAKTLDLLFEVGILSYQ